jgi:hypothetical protein
MRNRQRQHTSQVMVDRTTLISDIDAAVVMTVVILILMMRMGVIDGAGCCQIIRNVVFSLDIVPKVRDEQRHDRGTLGHQKETQEPGSKPAQFA